MAGGTKITGQLFPRKKYAGAASARYYSPADRTKLVRLLGQGYKLHLMTRVYDRSATGGPSASFDILHGCFGQEFPSDALRQFSLTPSVTTPNLPYDSTNMTSVPDDGYVVVSLGMGAVDVMMKVWGSGSCWIELETWYTLEMEQ